MFTSCMHVWMRSFTLSTLDGSPPVEAGSQSTIGVVSGPLWIWLLSCNCSHYILDHFSQLALEKITRFDSYSKSDDWLTNKLKIKHVHMWCALLRLLQARSTTGSFYVSKVPQERVERVNKIGSYELKAGSHLLLYNGSYTSIDIDKPNNLLRENISDSEWIFL